MQVPHDWRSLGITAVNTTCWYKRTVEGSQLTEEQVVAAKEGRLRLGLGTVAAADTTYINGIEVGTIGLVNGTAPHDQTCHDCEIDQQKANPCNPVTHPTLSVSLCISIYISILYTCLNPTSVPPRDKRPCVPNLRHPRRAPPL